MRPEPTSTIETEDIWARQAVLLEVLARHPRHLKLPELVTALADDSAGFAAGDAITRAIRDLTGLRLLDCRRGRVRPSDHALALDEHEEPSAAQ